MKSYFVFILIVPLFLFSQKFNSVKKDSVAYYINHVNQNKAKHKFKNCFNFALKALNYASKSNNKNSLAASYLALGGIYLDLDKYTDAEVAFAKSADIYVTLPICKEQAILHYYLSICQIKNSNFENAKINLDKSETYFKKLNSSNFDEKLTLQKGILFKEKKQFELALLELQTVIDNEDTQENLKTKAEALYHIGAIEIIQKKYSTATKHLNQALHYNQNIDLELKTKILLALSEVYEQSQDFGKSFSLLKQYISLKDSLTLQKNKRKCLSDIDFFNELEQIKAIEYHETEKKIEQKANAFAKLTSILAIALISILSLLSLSLYKNNILRSNSNNQLKEKNAELEIAKENAEKATKIRSEFLSTVSHELRTPLNAITGITHLLIEEEPKESQITYLNSLKFSGNYLLHFINDILEINRIESENIPIENININLEALIISIQNSFNEISQENNNQLIIEIDSSVPENIVCDPTKLSQIFINLVNNSLKFTKNGFVKLTANLQSIESNKVNITFKVADNGIGIPEDKQSSIFDSFSQGSIEINRKYGGTGLGLTIVKKLIELLRGTIYLESKVGFGTTFTFTLPFEIGEKIIETKKEFTYDEKVLKNKKILLVEDNKINQMITKKMLENKGMTCQILESGEESIEIIKNKNDYDLVLMDVHLNGINGTIATQQIRKFNTSLPIIALTAISLNENREMLLSFGMNDVITKPFEPNQFYKIIAENIIKK